MKPISRIRWGRIVTAAVLSEVAVIAILLAAIAAYRFLIAPGKSAAEYAAFGDLAGYYVAPAAAGFATFFGALWVTRKATSSILANGSLVGIFAVVLTGGLIFVAKPEDRLMYGVSFLLRIVGAYLGGVVAQRRTCRRPASVPTMEGA